MNRQLQTPLMILGLILIAGASLLYGALTAPQKQQPAATPQEQTKQETPSPKPAATTLPTKDTLEDQLPAIKAVIAKDYPKIITDYTLTQEKLHEKGKWYSAVLIYKGSDTMNRDTLRLLLQKKDDAWTVRTTPPQPLLAAKQYPDVPKTILKEVNQAVSLPGTDTTAGE